MNKVTLKEKADILAQVVLLTADLYHSELLNEAQKGLLETLLGAGIWYLPSSKLLFSGKISKAAINALETEPTKTKLVEEHGFPRKVAGRSLYVNHLNDLKNNVSKLEELYINKFGRYNLVLKAENDKLKKFQKVDIFTTEEDAYTKADIELVEIDEKTFNKFPVLFKYKINLQEIKFSNKATSRNREKSQHKQNIKDVPFLNIEVNGKLLFTDNNNNPTDCYMAFMKYTIDIHHKKITNSTILSKYFKSDSEDPAFGRAVFYNKIQTHQGYSFSTYQDTKSKVKIINEIANETGDSMLYI